MRLQTILDTIKYAFTQPTVNTTLLESASVLNTQTSTDYSVAVIDLLNSTFDEDSLTASFRVYVLDRSNTNEVYGGAISKWDWATDTFITAFSRLVNNDSLTGVRFGQINYVLNDFADLLCGGICDIDLTIPMAVECV